MNVRKVSPDAPGSPVRGQSAEKRALGVRTPERAVEGRTTLSFRIEGRPCAYVRMTRGTKWGARAQRYLAYREALGYRAKEAGAMPGTGPVRVYIQAYVTRRTFDLDNLVKAVLDGLNGVAFADDKQVCIIHAAIAITASAEELYVTVNAWEGE